MASDREVDSQPQDFREQLRTALDHATPLNLDDPLSNGEIASGYSEKPDDFVLSFLYVPSPNQVYTTDASQYLSLLKQAAEVIDDNPDLSDATTTWLEQVAKHEAVHGQTAKDLGNSDTVSYFGVEFVIDDSGTSVFWPYHFTEGPLKKIHQAWVAVAPEDRSEETDIAIASDLGYTDLDDLRERAMAEAPVEEGWERVVEKADVIEALQRLMMADHEDSQQ